VAQNDIVIRKTGLDDALVKAATPTSIGFRTEPPMRPRFSLRLLLFVFTAIAILLGAGANLFFRPYFRARRHQAAVNKLHEMGHRIRIAPYRSDNDAGTSSFIEANWREWNAEGFPHISEFWQRDLSERITSKEAEAALSVLQELRNVPAIRMNVDHVTPEIVNLIAKFPKCTELDLQFAELDPDAGEALSKLRQVNLLILDGPLNDEGAAALGRLATLTSLTVEVSDVSNEALASLANASNLLRLTLRGSIKGPELFAALAHHKIYELCLSRATLKDLTADAFCRLNQIHNIEISGDCQLPPSWWRSAARLPRLEKFTIKNFPQTSKLEIESLANSVTLTTLEMESYALTPAQLRLLEGHPSLESLTYCGKLTLDEIKEFLTATPRCSLTLVEPLDSDSEVTPPGTTYYFFKGEVITRPWPESYCGGCWIPFTP
jgi:hypothetical protein